MSKDFVEVQACYHVQCMSKFYVNRISDEIGRLASANTTDFIQHAISYIDENKSESQFSLNEIKNEFNGDFPALKTIKAALLKYYSEGELQFIHLKTDLIILFRHKISKEMWKEWYNSQEKDPELERIRIVKMAGNIILQDIRKTIYDKNNYIIPQFNEKNIFENIPETLVNFLDIVIKTHKDRSKKSQFKWQKRIAAISHSIITSARPRSFLSPILLGLSSMMHKKYASKGLIDALSYLGLCASYDETLRFEASIVNDPDNHSCDPECFIQYIFDNADHNTCTIDGKNAFHAMGGLKVATPSSGVTTKKTIARVNKIPSSDTIGKFGFTDIKRFEKKNAKGLKTTLIKNIKKKHGLRCTDLCTKCHGSGNCLNVERVSQDFEESEDNSEIDQRRFSLTSENKFSEESEEYSSDGEETCEYDDNAENESTNVSKKRKLR